VVVEVPVVGALRMEVVICSSVDQFIKEVVVESMFEVESHMKAPTMGEDTHNRVQGPIEAPFVEVKTINRVVKEAEPIEAMAGATKVKVISAVIHLQLTIKPA
jgi:hypothetical protein